MTTQYHGDLTVYDLLPEFDSYVADMEGCIREDQRTWKKYLKNATPFIADLLDDFGKIPEGTIGEPMVIIRKVAESYCR